MVRQENIVSIFPNFFSYIAKVSTLRHFDATFANTFGWDRFRQIILWLLEDISLRTGKPLVRLWYYPRSCYSNSVSFSADVDHRLAWELAKGVSRRPRVWAFLAEHLPYPIQRTLAIASSHRFFGKGLFRRPYMGTAGALVGRLCKNLGVNAPLSFFLASLNAVFQHDIPITVFVRPSAFQREESKMTYRFREAYRPTQLSNLEIALHFGATVGRTHQGEFIKDPCGIDVFREGILDQIICLKDDTGLASFGARLHHTFGFNQEMFSYLDAAPEVTYDSSVFGSVADLDTRRCPAGVSLPYFPVLHSDRNTSGELKSASFVELPTLAYETPDIPINSILENNSAIIVSEHPDKVRSPMTRAFVAYSDRYGARWWRVTLQQLATWWKTRSTLSASIDGGVLSVDSQRLINDNPVAACVVVYPGFTHLALPSRDDKSTRTMDQNGRLYIDLLVSRKAQNSATLPSRTTNEMNTLALSAMGNRSRATGDD
jgi:hypothetical protein